MARGMDENPALGVFARNTLKEQKTKTKRYLSFVHATCPIAMREEGRCSLSCL
jgi:hypothetical protein